MAQSSIYRSSQPGVIKVTLGSVVACGDKHGVVWQVTHDTLRVFPVERGRSAVRLSLANEVALHLPVSMDGWGIGLDRLLAWPRGLCHIVGELDEKCLLKILEARKALSSSLPPALAGNAMSAAVGPGFS
jgi:hypothetical protein